MRRSDATGDIDQARRLFDLAGTDVEGLCADLVDAGMIQAATAD